MSDRSTGLHFPIRSLRYIPEWDDGEEVVADIGVWFAPAQLFNIDFQACPSGPDCERYRFYLRQRERHNLVLAALANVCDPLSSLADIKTAARGPAGEFLFDGFFYDELIVGTACPTIQRYREFVQAVRADGELSGSVIAVAVGQNFNSFLSDAELMQEVEEQIDFWCPETYYRPSDAAPGTIVTEIATGECGIPSLDSTVDALAAQWPLVLEKTVPLLNVSDNFFEAACNAQNHYARKLAADGLSFGGYQSKYLERIAVTPGPFQRLAGVGFWSDRLATRHTVLETDRAFKASFLLRSGDEPSPPGAPELFNWMGNAADFASLTTPAPGVSRVEFFRAVQAGDLLFTSLRVPLGAAPVPGIYSLEFDYRTNYQLPLEGYLGYLDSTSGIWEMAAYDPAEREGDSAWHSTTMFFDPTDNISPQTAVHLAVSWHDLAISTGSFIEVRNVRLARILPATTESLFRSAQTPFLDGRLDSITGIVVGGSSPPQLALEQSAFLFPTGASLSVFARDTDAICVPGSTPCAIDYSTAAGCGIWSTLRASLVDDLPPGRYDLTFWYRASWTWCLPRSPGGTGCVDQGCQERPWVGLFKPPWDLLDETRSNFDLTRYDAVYATGSDLTGRRSDGQWHRLRFSFDLTQDLSGQDYHLHFANVWGDASVLKNSSFEVDSLELRRSDDPPDTSRVLDPWTTDIANFAQIDSQNLLAPITITDLVENSFFPQSQAHLVVAPGAAGPGSASIDLQFATLVLPGTIGLSIWAMVPSERSLLLTLIDTAGRTVAGRNVHVAGDETTWHNISIALPIPSGSQAAAVRIDFDDGSGFGPAPVFLDEISTFRVANRWWCGATSDPHGCHDGDECTDDLCDLQAGCNYVSIPGCCTTDADCDGVLDAVDNCEIIPNASQEDQDSDGIGDPCDNCPSSANPGQADGDLDGAGDLCDCAPVDGGAFAIPAEVTGLSFGPDAATLNWDSAAPGAGTATVHDVLRGCIHELPVGTGPCEICLAPPGTPGDSMTDPASPSAGEAFWYLVRGRNLCGSGAYGAASDGTERISIACP